MEQITNKEILNELEKLRIDINIIKGKLDEGELTDWAKEEFKKARKEPEENYTDLEDLKKEIEDDL